MITQATLFALFIGSVKQSEQSNNPVFTESITPGSGNPPWQWDVSNIRGFAGGAIFQFVSLGGDGTQARLEWSAIEDSDWTKAGGCEGIFDLRIFNNVDPDIIYPDFQISLRYLDCAGYTVFEGQTSGGSPLPPGDAGPYRFTAPLFAGGLPGDLDMEFDGGGGASGRGIVTGVTSAAAAWTESGTATLRIQDGTRPYSDIPSVPINLRQLNYTTIIWFDNQTAVDPTTINGSPSGDSYTWLSSDERVVISNGGGTRVEEQITGSGVEAGTDIDFNLIITDGTRPESHIPCTLKARHVTDPINIPYTASSGSETVEVTGDSVTVWNFGTGVFSGIESVLSFNGGVGNTASISWGDDALINDDSGTLTFTIQPNDASAPSCTVLVNVNISVTTNIVDTTKPMVIDCTFEIV